MIHIGEVNNLIVKRKVEFGYYLDGGTERLGDDVLLPHNNTLGKNLEDGEEVEAFIYRDSKDRIVATLKKPFAKVGDVAYLEVVASTKIGNFVNFGLEKDILVPFKEENYALKVGNKYLFYIYLDKTQRLAATTYIDAHLHDTNALEIGQETWGTAYGIQTNGSIMLAIENTYRGVVLKKENYGVIQPGDIVQVRIKKYYEDGKMEVTPRKTRLVEKESIEQQILAYLEEQDGFMPYGDKSSPEAIKSVFHCSKNAFKRALGGLMKENKIIQSEEGTKLK